VHRHRNNVAAAKAAAIENVFPNIDTKAIDAATGRAWTGLLTYRNAL
jgi:hypothetical protein